MDTVKCYEHNFIIYIIIKTDNRHNSCDTNYKEYANKK